MPRQRIPVEIHKLRGTWRRDRQGPKPSGVVNIAEEPDVLWVVEGGEHPFVCPRCEGPLDLVLLANRRWREDCPSCADD